MKYISISNLIASSLTFAILYYYVFIYYYCMISDFKQIYICLLSLTKLQAVKMTAGSTFYLEHYLDSLEELPNDLKSNFNNMHDLDKRFFTSIIQLLVAFGVSKNINNHNFRKWENNIWKIFGISLFSLDNVNIQIFFFKHLFSLIGKSTKNLPKAWCE